jgi:serine/threonine protein kinase
MHGDALEVSMMTVPTATEFWELLAQSGLVTADAMAGLRREHAAATGAGSDGKGIARWLAERGAITPWQAKRLGIGNLGPFFLGDYRLLERHERDGAELVFSARHEPSGRGVTLVLLNRKQFKQLDVWTEIVRRTRAATETTDPMLSRTWSLEQHEGSRFVVCEEVGGGSLADEIEQAGPLPAVQAGVLVSQLARAVADIHAHGAVHGGLSLEVLRREPPPGGLPRTGRVRLMQFPLAGDPHRVLMRPWEHDEDIPRLGRRACYVAPELTLPGAVCDQRSDVYAIGAILYALLTGAAPCWEGDASKTLRRAALGEGPRPLGPPTVSPEMATLVGYLMARDPAERYQNAAEAAEAVAATLGLAGSAPAAARPPSGPAFEGAAFASGPGAAALPELAGIGEQLRTDVAGSPAPQNSGQRPSGASAIERTLRRRAARLRMIGGAITLAVLGGVAALVVSRIDFSTPAPPPPIIKPPVARTDRPDVPPVAAGTEPAAANPGGPPVGAASRQIVVADDSLPWASPTDGPRPRLAYLPPGSQLGLVGRPADLLAAKPGRLFLESLGPAAKAALGTAAAFCGCQEADIELVQAGWQAGAADEILAGYAVRLTAGRTVVADEAARRQAWGSTTAREIAGETVHVGTPFSFWVPSWEEGRVLVIASAATLATALPALPAGGGPASGPVAGEDPPAGGRAAGEPFIASIVRQSLEARDRPAEALLADLPLQLETLVGMLDADWHVTLFGSPHYLLNRGRGVLAGPLAKLVGPLKHLFGDSIRGVALSAHVAEQTYLELDVVAERDPPARAFAPQLAEHVEGLPAVVEDYCAQLAPDPYGRVLVMRLPAMLRILAATMRVGVEGNGVVLNAYLPAAAAHNLALAAELVLAQTPGATVAVAGPAAPSGSVPPDGPAPSAGVLGKLQKKVTIVFPRDTLETAIQMVSDEVGVPLEILGPDLQLDGITQNQSFGLEARDQAATEVLRTILAQANPDGKLVYIVRTENGTEKILITTRAQVEKRGDPLPPEFQTTTNPETKQKP